MKNQIIITLGLCLVLTACQPNNSPEQQEKAELTKLSQEEMQWWTDAKFGMFIHWGPYSELGGEWNGQQLPVGIIAEWIMQKLEIPVEEYREMAAQFNPVHFDAAEWVNLASNAGMKYLVITAKHHDGFAMYHSEVSDYNIVDYTPFKRDPLKELSLECAEKDIRFSFYYSHREDWDHPYAYGNYWDYETSQQDGFNYDPDKPFTTYLEEKAKPQLRELLSSYGPIGLVWFDRGMFTREQGMEFVSLVRELQPNCLINGRVGNYNLDLIGDYQSMSDNGMPPGGVEELWETPQTLNHTWGYSKFDHEWKSAGEVIGRLVEIVSKGGNYLLNIGPKGDGSIPEASIQILTEVGSWMDTYGQSIYGTTASPLNSQTWGFCTTRDSLLYLHVLDWPKNGGVEVSGLINKPVSARLMGSELNLDLEERNSGIFIQVPEEQPDPYVSVIKLQVVGLPESNPPLIDAEPFDTITLGYLNSVTSGNATKRFNRKGNFFISRWTRPEDEVSWNVQFESPSEYSVMVRYSAPDNSIGKSYTVVLGEEQLNASVQKTGVPFDYKEFEIGTIGVQDPGTFQLRMFPSQTEEGDLIYFHSLKLCPIN